MTNTLDKFSTNDHTFCILLYTHTYTHTYILHTYYSTYIGSVIK